MTHKKWLWLLLAMISVAAIGYYFVVHRQRHRNSLATRLDQVVPVRNQTEVPCTEVANARPLVLLALGQSNAGNHGDPATRPLDPIVLFAEGKCITATDPLPGGTGSGGSIWQRLPAMFETQGYSRPVVLSVLAIDATSIGDWTRPDSPLRIRLVSHIQSMRNLDLPPHMVLWQQGEADAALKTGKKDYLTGLDRLAATLDEAGSKALIILARSTICRTLASHTIRDAIEEKVSIDPRFRLGPDCDTLSGDALRDGCHLTEEGLNTAAKMWFRRISIELPKSDFSQFQ